MVAVTGVLFPSWSRAEGSLFPAGFRWCVATAAHQIEGGNFNSDWWRFQKQPGHIKKGHTSEVADDHWNRLEEDMALLKELHVTDYRMSVEWAKIEPQPGLIDAAVVAHYRREIELLNQAGIQPIITLQHFTFPMWVRERGGFEWPGLPEAFAKYAEVVYNRIAPEARDWVTINEPMVTALAGYVAGVVPPMQKRDIDGLPQVLVGILKSHAAAYHKLHRLAVTKKRLIRVGMAHHLRTMDPYYPLLLSDVVLAHYADQAFNWSLPEAMETGRFKFDLLWKAHVDQVIPNLARTQDFVGVNYYSGDLVHLSFDKGFELEKRVDLPQSDLGWPIYPEGFLRLLRGVAERFPGQPILITENGIADSKDRLRPQFLRDHLETLSQAMAEGIPVEGYCHWSLYDNFEWIEGYDPRFGLYEVDYATQARRPRGSARLFSHVAQHNRLPPEGE